MPADLPLRPPVSSHRRRWLARLALALSLGLFALIGGALGVHPFLAHSHPVAASTLVVEGWLPDYALQAAQQEFQKGSYRQLITTGGPLERGSFLSEHKTYAELARATFIRLGLSSNQVVAVPAKTRQRNRTFASAVALHLHAVSEKEPMDAINLVSLGAHSRRSQICFQRALGPQVQVGIIAVPSDEYAADAWWRSSAGVKQVVGEILGLIYSWSGLDFGT